MLTVTHNLFLGNLDKNSFTEKVEPLYTPYLDFYYYTLETFWGVGFLLIGIIFPIDWPIWYYPTDKSSFITKFVIPMILYKIFEYAYSHFDYMNIYSDSASMYQINQ